MTNLIGATVAPKDRLAHHGAVCAVAISSCSTRMTLYVDINGEIETLDSTEIVLVELKP